MMLDCIIIFGQNIDRLKRFYIDILKLSLVEEIISEWVLLDAGNCRIGLHKVGKAFRQEKAPDFKVSNNTKLIFMVDEDIVELRNSLLHQNVTIREIKTFDNYDFWICDGEDPEGNVFQLKQKKRSY